ncbi:MAG: hypothetical protein JNM81_11685 [Rhodospirillaceae bacterium]|nr:hypothetical protein [Rhodospirillaceae bacterium]
MPHSVSDHASAPSQRAWCVTVVGTVILACAALGYGAAQISRASMSASVAAAPKIEAAAVTEVVVEVLDETGGEGAHTYTGRVAVKSGAVYRRSDQTVRFDVPANTPFVMGVPADLHVGAIVHVRGVANGDLIATERIVILTPNVKFEDALSQPAPQ